tara:strand:+ start:687 stop:1544 length:858 start_codon:yes stop_codon:yes gene_type:complete
MKYFISIVLTVFIGFSSVAQSIHEYEYVLVPTRYDFSSYADKFQLNSLTTFLFNREGFKAYTNTLETIPGEVAANSCKALYVNVKDNSGVIRTRLQIELKDCDGKVIFVTQVGDSKLKDYTKAHHEALREAFRSIEDLNYSFKPKTLTTPRVQSPATDLISISKEEEKKKVKKKVIEIVQTEQDLPVTITHKSAPQVISDSANQKENPVSYVSENSSYILLKKGENYIIYDDALIIGQAEATSGGQFLITTSSFNGVGRLEGDNFIIDRQIKGVSGLVQMIFTKE